MDSSHPSPRRLRRLVAVAGAALLVAVAVAGCGDDDGDTASSPDPDRPAGTEAETEADTGTDAVAEYCDAALAVELFPEPAIDETMGEAEVTAAIDEFATGYRPLLDAALAAAPDEITEDGETVVAAFEELVATGDFAGFDRPDVLAALDRIHRHDLDNCGWNEVEVTATDYSFDGLPDTLPAGPTSLELSNEGAEIHHMVVARIDDDVTMTLDELLQLDQEEAAGHVEFMPGEPFALPGESDHAVGDLAPGRYLAACFIPVGTTGFDAPEGGPPHFTHGMVAEITVE